MASRIPSLLPEDAVARPFPVPTGSSDPFDDMTDTPEERAAYPDLPFEAFDEICAEYRRADRAALEHQVMHGLLTRFAVGGGALAVIAAILELPKFLSSTQITSRFPWLATPLDSTDQWLGGLALLSAAVAFAEFFWRRGKQSGAIHKDVRIAASLLGLSWLAAVVWMIRAGSEALVVVEGWAVIVAVACWLIGRARAEKDQWLAFRHEAEAYRLVKFEFLFAVHLWTGREELRQKLESKKIPLQYDTSRKGNRFSNYLSDAICTLAHGPFPVTTSLPPSTIMGTVVDYYLMKRLRPQMAYLENRTKRNESVDVIWRHLLDRLFLYSVGAAIIHLIFTILKIEWVREKLKGIAPLFADQSKVDLIGDAAIFFALLAALFPVFSAGIRVWRGAYEFARNSSRYSAAHFALQQLEKKLRADAGSAPRGDHQEMDVSAVLQELHWCEHILSTEHIEWLRLMVEAEWYL